MKYAIVSDLHVDFWGPLDWATVVREPIDVLIIAGDLDNSALLAELVVQHACEMFPQVVYCDGNHEHYKRSPVTDTMERFRRLAKETPNLTYLDGETYRVVDDVAVVGANGWYDFKMNPEWITPEQCRKHWLTSNNNSRQILFDVSVEALARRQVAALKETIRHLQNEPISSIVVATHTVPHRLGLMIKQDPEWNLSNGAFGNSLMEEIWSQDWTVPIHSWCFGHIHFMSDFDSNGIRFICNPRGYPFEMLANYEAVYVDTDERLASAFGRIER